MAAPQAGTVWSPGSAVPARLAAAIPGSQRARWGTPCTNIVSSTRVHSNATLVAEGLSNAEVAARLVVSPATAKTHVGHLLSKLQARDRTQLVVIAYENGVVAPGG